MFSPDFISTVKNSVNMRALADEYTFLSNNSGDVWQGECPNPSHKDSSPSFTVWESTNSWACMGCHNGVKDKVSNHGSDCIAFIQWIENLDFISAVKFLAEKQGIPIPNNKNQSKYNYLDKLSKEYVSNITQEAYDYLMSRNMKKETIIKWRIGYNPKDKRITFPLFDRYKKVIGFTNRTIQDGAVKYINSKSSEIFNKSSYFYGAHLVDTKFPYIRITEGPMDVIVADSYGLKNVVATLGTAFTETHAKEIAKLRLQPILIFDGDTAGQKATLKAINILLNEGVQPLVVTLPTDRDLAELCDDIKYGIEEYIISEQVTYSYMKARNIIEEYNKELYGLKLKMFPKVKEILKEVPDEERIVLKDYLEKEIKMGVD